jgi:hypothetical protein
MSDLLQRLRQRALSTASAKSVISTPEWNHFLREDIEQAANRIEALEAACQAALATLEALHPDQDQLTSFEVARLYNATTDSLTKLLQGA